MPDWLKVVAAVNPLTYMVDALRQLMVEGGVGADPIGLDIAVLLATSVVLIWLAARLYPRLAQ